MSRTREYIETKNIGNLFEQLMRHVLSKRPDNPVQFLVKLLQDKGDSIMTDPVASVHTNGGLECSGHAIDIRKSLERILPTSFSHHKPVQSPLPDKLVEPGTDNGKKEKTEKLKSKISPKEVSPQDSLPTESSENIQVSQEVVTAVQSSRPKSGRKSSSSSSSTETLKSTKSDGSKKKKKVKKKRNESDKASETRKSDKSTTSKTNVSSKVLNEKKVKPKQEDVTEKTKEEDTTMCNGNDEINSLITGTCDLTEMESWNHGELETETLSCITIELQNTAVLNNTMSMVHAAPPSFSPTPIKQNETEILQEEGFTHKTNVGDKTFHKMRVTSPCTTVFFDESDTEPPLIQEPEIVVPVRNVRPVPTEQSPGLNGQGFPVIDTYRSDTGNNVSRDVSLQKLLNNDNTSDKMSISELSGIEWGIMQSLSDDEKSALDT